MTFHQALAAATARLSAASPSARLDAEVLLAHACRVRRSAFLANPDRALDTHEAAAFDALVQRRRLGEPIAYITGHREFWSLDLLVTPAVLIPRPETELLVECALALLPGDEEHLVADLGTGSGAVALALASERPHWRVVACERDRAALEVADRNRERLGLANVELRGGDWLQALDGDRLDLMVANPPYVADGDPHLAEGDLRFEPRSALVSGCDGLDAIRQLVAAAPERLSPGGWLVLEHGYDQGERVGSLMRAAGLDQVCTDRDLAGNERVSRGQRN